MSAPTSQKADVRPISFVLVDESRQIDIISPKRVVTLYIRPEELTRIDPSRLTTTQTLGKNAFADDFGTGIPAINIQGHTGWHRSADINANDGEARFLELKNQVYTEWHRRREEARKSGIDPEKIKLIFADALDSFAAVVAPISFTLRRSRARPLLLQYQIALTVIDENIDQAEFFDGVNGRALGAADLQISGLDSLLGSINKITDFLRDIETTVDRAIVAPVADFMRKTNQVYLAVNNAIRAGDGVADSLITVARLSSQAGLNIFRTLAAVVGIPSLTRVRLMQIAGAYSNVFCVLRNAINQQLFFEDYSPLFGASTCSSTAGGRPPSPLSGVNPFYLVDPTPVTPPVQVSFAAHNSMVQLASNDVALSPTPIPDLLASVRTIANGTVIA